MAHNFRLTGDRYISKDGSASNDGLTPDTPKNIFAEYIQNGTQIVGSGQYNGTFSLNAGGVSAIAYFIADGVVTLNLTGNFAIGSPTDGGRVKHLRGFNIEMNGFSYVHQQNAGVSLVTGCVISNGVFASGSGGAVEHDKCVFNNMTGTVTSIGISKAVTYRNCALFNCTYNLNCDTNKNFINTYVSPSSVITLDSYFTNPSTQFTKNNFQGAFVIGGNIYELKRDKAGNVINPNPTYLDIDILEGGLGNVYSRGNFSQDPEFVNLAKGDYWSVSSTSPNFFIANSKFANIGNAKLAITSRTDDVNSFDMNDATDLSLSSGNIIFDFTSLDNQGIIRSKPIDLGKVMALENISAIMALNFNSDLPLGDKHNSSVLQVTQEHISGTAEANPARLTYKLRWTKNSVMPTSDLDWDNQSYLPAGEFGLFEINTGAKVSNAVNNIYTSGQLGFNNTNNTFVVARWIQVELYINRGIKIVT